MAKGDEYSSVEHEWFTALEAKLVRYEYRLIPFVQAQLHFRAFEPVEMDNVKVALEAGFKWVRTDHWCRDGSDWAVFEKQVV